ncbi:dihydrofolate reductase [Marinilabiliaceae bacterium JC017]|nr:dihydrofolate reductase [Marinilabiliaceae bacterium JC017]
MTISLIVAIDRNNGIGKNNDQLVYISGDLKRFKALTTGHTIVMGRKTFEALPKGALPKRRNVVITRQADFAPPGCDVVHSLEEALTTCRHDDQIFVIGGGEIYKAFLPHAQRLILTKIDYAFEGVDTFFPEINKSEWQCIEEDGPHQDERNKISYRYVTLERQKDIS